MGGTNLGSSSPNQSSPLAPSYRTVTKASLQQQRHAATGTEQRRPNSAPPPGASALPSSENKNDNNSSSSSAGGTERGQPQQVTAPRSMSPLIAQRMAAFRSKV
mmetsp:Transcript_54393/g.109392  ORF Transcript_54393/g.109392 Transcript_54393/m.109392 type:complete len:104 (+) Transcript_54393:568-879(+)